MIFKQLINTSLKTGAIIQVQDRLPSTAKENNLRCWTSTTPFPLCRFVKQPAASYPASTRRYWHGWLQSFPTTMKTGTKENQPNKRKPNKQPPPQRSKKNHQTPNWTNVIEDFNSSELGFQIKRRSLTNRKISTCTVVLDSYHLARKKAHWGYASSY